MKAKLLSICGAILTVMVLGSSQMLLSIAHAQPVTSTIDSITWGSATLVQSYAAFPQISIGPTDKIFISWRADGYEDNAFLRRSNNGGQSFDSAVLAANPVQNFHTLFAGNNENVYIAWINGLANGLYISRSTDSGASFGNAIRIDDVETGGALYSTYPDLAQDASGTLYAVWSQTTTTTHGVYFAKSTNEGTSFSSSIPVYEFPDSSNSFTYFNPSIAVASNGTIYVAWQDHQETGAANVYFSRSTDGGATFEPKRRVNDVVFTQGTEGAYGQQLAAFGSEQVYVVWQDFRNGSYDIYFSRSTDGGISFQPNQRVNEDIGIQINPSIAVGPSGQILVSWLDTRNSAGGQTRWDIYTSLSTDRGVTFGPNTRANPPGDSVGAVESSFTAFDSTGRPHIVWWGAGDDIYYSTGSDGTGTPPTPTPIPTPTATPIPPPSPSPPPPPPTFTPTLTPTPVATSTPPPAPGPGTPQVPRPFTLHAESGVLPNITFTFFDVQLTTRGVQRAQVDSVTFTAEIDVPTCGAQAKTEVRIFSKGKLVWQKVSPQAPLLVFGPIIATATQSVTISVDKAVVVDRGNAYILFEYFTSVGDFDLENFPPCDMLPPRGDLVTKSLKLNIP